MFGAHPCRVFCTKETLSKYNGGTPLNKLSIGIHTNTVLRDCNSTPHVTIFWKFCWQKLLWQRLNFNLSSIWWNGSVYQDKVLRYKPVNSTTVFSVLHACLFAIFEPRPLFMCLRSIKIQIKNWRNFVLCNLLTFCRQVLRIYHIFV